MSSATLGPLSVKRRAGVVPSDGWWGDGPPPTELWPGVTIVMPAAWRSNTSRWESLDGLFFFDHQEADRACDFFPRYLRHYLGEFAGQPFALMSYQRLLLTLPLFGWKSTSTGFRRFQKVFAFIPKGGGKSPWGAGTGLYLAFCDHEPGAEVYAVAADKKQARTVHDNSRFMVETIIENEPEFKDLLTVYRDSIVCEETRSKYEVISADAGTKHGFRPHGVIFDELHAQRNRLLYEALKRSMVKRRQPVMIILTHAGYDDEGICAEEYDYAKGVLSGNSRDYTCLPVIFEADPKDDWTSPEVWRRVNPGHGITVKHDGVASECQESLVEPRKRNDFLRFHLNRWTSQATAWIPLDWWDACPGLPPETDLRTWRCSGGLDLAQKWDLAAFVVVFRQFLETAVTAEIVTPEGEGFATKIIGLNYRLAWVPFFWIPEDTMREHEYKDGVPYSQWVQDGLITPTPGVTIDYHRIYEDITTKILPRFPLLKQGTIGYDPAFATDIATNLRDRAHLTVLEVPQNYQHLSEPSQVVEALIKGKRLHRDPAQRTLRNHVEHVAVKTDDAGRIRPVKPKQQSKRIDGVVAGIMGTKMVVSLSPPPTYQMFFLGAKA